MRWIQRAEKEIPNADDSIVEKIGKKRGIKDINRFLNPSENEMFDPYLIKNIEKASERIVKAIKEGQRICLSYDADSDGITSTTVIRRYLSEYTNNIDYIYNERRDGHGIHEQTKLSFVTSDDIDEEGNITDEDKKCRYELNSSNLSKIKESDLLIIIDSSSNDAEACKKLVEDYGIDIIIIDHHEIEKENNHALIVNPQQEGDEYPNKHLSGAGVVYKVLHVLEDLLQGGVNIHQYIDLVGVGMYSDMMKVNVYENRYMISKALRSMRNVGLVRILKGAKADFYKLNGDSIGFSIAPMINGVARLNNIKLAIDILMTDDDKVAKKLRLQMHKLNEKRKAMQKEITERYMESIDETKKMLIVTDENSSKGFNGLVAQQLANTYKRPVIVGRVHKGQLSGSFRSYNGFNLNEFLSESNLTEETVGHKEAGGVSLSVDNIDILTKYVEENMPELESREPTVYYDVEIDASEVEDYIKPMEQFNFITGNGFTKVITRVNGVAVEEASIIGKTQETCKIKTLGNLELIKFKVSQDYGSDLGFYDEIDVVGGLHMNEFYNFGLKKKIKTPQIILSDYKIIDE